MHNLRYDRTGMALTHYQSDESAQANLSTVSFDSMLHNIMTSYTYFDFYIKMNQNYPLSLTIAIRAN